MGTEMGLILVFGVPFVVGVVIGIVMLHFGWRSWNDPQVTMERFVSSWQIRLVKKLYREEGYRKWQMSTQRQSIRRLLAAFMALLGASVLLVMMWYGYMIISELLG